MTAAFSAKLDEALSRSAAQENFIQRDRRIVLRAGIDSEAKLLRLASSKRAPPRLLTIVAWLLPRWPGGARRAAFFHAAQILLTHPLPEVRAEAAVSMGLFRLKNAPSILLQALDDRDDEVRCRILASLGLHGDVRTMPALVEILADRTESAAVRATAADALSGFRGSSSQSALLSALSDPSVSVRASSAQSLGELRVRSAGEMLGRLAERDASLMVRDTARSALIRITHITRAPQDVSKGKPRRRTRH